MEIMIRNDIDWVQLKKDFKTAKPFNHIIIDNFFLQEVAEILTNEFPDYCADGIIKYENALENKHTLNQWDKFPTLTYKTFDFLGKKLVEQFRIITDEENLNFDFGLHGGGWHMHGRGGNNNIHLDYNLHPKLKEQRKLNIIIYMTKDWDPAWGGGLELWENDEKTRTPLKIHTTVENKFNRAIIFDTTQNSWHGLPKKLDCPDNIIRKSLAAYYTFAYDGKTEERSKALFVPREEQKGNKEVLDLIKKRSDINLSREVYRK